MKQETYNFTFTPVFVCNVSRTIRMLNVESLTHNEQRHAADMCYYQMKGSRSGEFVSYDYVNHYQQVLTRNRLVTGYSPVWDCL